MVRTGVLLLHGLTGVPSEMRPVEKALQKLGFETYAPMLAGHGSTNDELLSVGWREWLAGAQKALDDLSMRVDQVVVCGLSMGASICSVLASNNQNVCGLIMLSPTLRYDSPEMDRKWHLRALKSQLVRDILHVVLQVVPPLGKVVYWSETPPYGLKDERLQRQITKAIEAAKRGEDTKFGLFRTYYISLQQMNFISDAFKQSAPKITCPALIVSSLEDTLVSTNNATDSYSMLGTQNKSLVMLTGCDHVLTLDLKRNFVAGLVGEFMEAVTDVSAQPITNADMELSLEIHNKINPLSNLDWMQLIPGAPALPAFVETLQARNVHEWQCHTLVVRRQNQPLLMVPLVVEATKQNLLIGVGQSYWRKAPPAAVEADMLAAAWSYVERIIDIFSCSYRIKHREYLPPVAAGKLG